MTDISNKTGTWSLPAKENFYQLITFNNKKTKLFPYSIIKYKKLSSLKFCQLTMGAKVVKIKEWKFKSIFIKLYVWKKTSSLYFFFF